MAASASASSSALLLPLPTATPRFARPPIGVPALSLGFSRVSISATGALALRPLVRRHREETSFGVARAGETGEEAEESGEEGSEGESGAGEEESGDAAAVAVVEEKAPRKPTVKLNEIIGVLNKRFIEELETIKPVPDIRPGDIIELKKQKANRRRLALYKGIVIAKNSAGVHTTIRIRYMTSGTAVEIVFPVYSPTIKEIKVVSHRDVRRAKLFYLREKLPRFYTFKKK